jgi:hypothetical protein
MMSRKQIRLHLQSWFYIWNVENFNIVDILYVVGGTCNPFCDNSFLDITYANPHKNINFLSLHRIADEEINSPEKLFEALDYISGHMTYNYAFNVHPRTYANVRSLVKMLKGNSPFEALYIGRPKVISLHSYDALKKQFEGLENFYYCSKSGYGLSNQTMQLMQGKWRSCSKYTYLKTKLKIPQMSKEFLLALCLHRLGIIQKCHVNYRKTINFPPTGMVKLETHLGHSVIIKTLFCEDNSGMGHPKNDIAISSPYIFRKSDLQTCVVFYPLKYIEHFEFVEYARSRMHRPEKLPRKSKCHVAIGILSRPKNFIGRHSLRSTVGEIAKVMKSVQLYFILGKSLQKFTDSEVAQLNGEVESFHDILFLNVTEKYENLFEKTWRWFQWGTLYTGCSHIFKTDDDGYIRLLPLVDALHKSNDKRLDPQKELYFGGHLWKGAPVVMSKKNPWYMYDVFPHKTFPPYMSGSGYGLSKKLAFFVARQASLGKKFRVEDAGIGICVSKYPNANFRFLQLGANKTGSGGFGCNQNTEILDNPAFNKNFNVYKSFEDDLYGIFCCTRSKRWLIHDHHLQYLGGSHNSVTKSFGRSYLSRYAAYDIAPIISPWRGKTLGFGMDLWGEIIENKIHAGRNKVTVLKRYETEAVVSAKRQIRVHLQKSYSNCQTIIYCGLWKLLFQWDRSDFLALIKCSGTNLEYLVYIPYRGGVFMSPVSSVQILQKPIVITVPFACKIHELKNFLEINTNSFTQIRGEKRIIISWSFCDTFFEELNKIQYSELQEIVSSFSNETGGQVIVDVVYQKTKYSRSASINFGLTAGKQKEIAIVLETNTIVKSSYFQRARAFAQNSATFYCPFATISGPFSPITSDDILVKKRNHPITQTGVFSAAATVQDIQNYMLRAVKDSNDFDSCFHSGLKNHPLYIYRMFDASLEIKEFTSL